MHKPYAPGYPTRCPHCRQMQHSPKAMKHHRCRATITTQPTPR